MKTKDEVQRSISTMKNHKAPGVDAISAEVLKAGGDEMIKFLVMLFNKVWREENPPLEWSKMIVTPVHNKGNNKTDPSNYQAISLLSIPGKVFSHILLQRIKQKSEKFTKENQYGFHPTEVLLMQYLLYVKLLKRQKNAK